ncbi:MAG: biotin synthase BioB [Thermodesulfobacteriota bacterium]
MNYHTVEYGTLIASVEERILAGGALEREEGELLLDLPDEFLLHLLAAADRIRIRFKGSFFDSCALVNARSGRCSEDCAFCAQSARYDTDAQVYGLLSAEEILSAAREAQEIGASRFCTVTSGGALSAAEFDSLMEALDLVRSEVDIALDASLGFLDDRRAQRLLRAGVTRYNHNIETCRDHYPSICTTHRFDQRLETVRVSMENGLSTCCGGIMGLGETPGQRLDMAFTLRDVGVDCVPLNILNPRPGTPLQNSLPPQPLEILKTVAIFRLVLPHATIKIAGGREKNLGDFQAMALRSGANGMIVGGYLTTSGRAVEEDLRMIAQAGYTMERPR